jgi:hypothetical protein
MKLPPLAKAFLFGLVCGSAFAADPLPTLPDQKLASQH